MPESHYPYPRLVNDPNAFYCCFVEGTGRLGVKYLSFEEAKEEAIRLVRKGKKKVSILKVVEIRQ